MKKYVFLLIFIAGLAIFSYPLISNFFSTKVHQSVIHDYDEAVRSMDTVKIREEKEKAERYNESLAGVPVGFTDPFSEGGGPEENQDYYDALNIGPAIGTVDIPKIGVELPIYHGTSEEVLSQGAGHLEKSSLPTGKPGTHAVLTAHRGLPSAKMFRNLNELSLGDQFLVKVLDDTMAYEVDRIEVVLPDETEWLQMSEGEDLVTLLTCDPYMINTHRLLVTGKRVPYEPETLETSAGPGKEVPTDRRYVWAAMAVAIATAAALILYLRRKKRMAARDEA
ncbi:class C sortase [Edaphobacillus lindanitolerans]|uniref:Sortase A n=1 Tax=Edaphobacillus lindanitolerans TaxID=550447 RepID=A0A1U7PIH4_9BACI|nr:class C sortase [Edaphobacillus lindanitolerans]SIT73935.1 sortase A [Edaphobacillus lindanitolerans]